MEGQAAGARIVQPDRDRPARRGNLLDAATAPTPDHEGEEKDLRRHVICFDRDTGKVLWDQAVEPVLPEDPYSGQFTQHGYASHTPVSDGKRIYVFFGKTGVLAFDLEGKKLWQTSVGTGSGSRGWGTASSPILYKNLVIVPAWPRASRWWP